MEYQAFFLSVAANSNFSSAGELVLLLLPLAAAVNIA